MSKMRRLFRPEKRQIPNDGHDQSWSRPLPRLRTMIVLFLIMVAGISGILLHLSRLNSKMIELGALEDVRRYSETLTRFRTLYTSEVVVRAKAQGIEVTHDYKSKPGAIPLPATLSMMLGNSLSHDSDGTKVRLFSRYPFPWRKNRARNDDFEREALRQLEQDPNQPFYRFEQLNGRPVLRYATADLMRQRCISCHNTHPDSPKTDWKVGDVRGVLEVIHPLENIAVAKESQLRSTFVLAIACGLGVFAVLAFLIFKNAKSAAEQARAIAEREHAERIQRDLQKALERAKQSEPQCRAILQTSADAIITIDESGRIESYNPTAEKVFGYTAEEALGQNISLLMPSPYKEEHDGYLARYRETGQKQVLGTSREVVGLRKSGDIFPLEVAFSEINVDGQRLFTGIARDISSYKIAVQRAEQASLAKSEFLANMSHEIRTPMTAILGFTDLLLDTLVDPDQIDAAQTVKRNGEHLISIINNILDLSKIESGKFEIEHVECSPQQIAAEVVSLMKVKADSKGLRLQLRCENPIPQTIQSDPMRLKQILINLTGNAVKFAEIGEVTLAIRFCLGNNGTPELQFDVIDSGIGMTKEQIARLFQPFMQVDTSATRKFGGTGLGLAISQRLAELLGGKISVTCVPGKGCTFRLTIPVNSDSVLTAPKTDAEPSSLTHSPADAAANDRQKLDCRILLVEDGPDNQRLITYILKASGADVSLAENGQIAIELVTATQKDRRGFDLILMDMQMPVLDGYAATRILRSQGYTRPIVALTAHAMAEDRAKCIEAGCSEYATKPIDRKELVELVRQCLQTPMARST